MSDKVIDITTKHDADERLTPRDPTPTPSSPVDAEGTGEKSLSSTSSYGPLNILFHVDLKSSRKREREVSLEPSTPKVRIFF